MTDFTGNTIFFSGISTLPLNIDIHNKHYLDALHCPRLRDPTDDLDEMVQVQGGAMKIVRHRGDCRHRQEFEPADCSNIDFVVMDLTFYGDRI